MALEIQILAWDGHKKCCRVKSDNDIPCMQMKQGNVILCLKID